MEGVSGCFCCVSQNDNSCTSGASLPDPAFCPSIGMQLPSIPPVFARQITCLLSELLHFAPL